MKQLDYFLDFCEHNYPDCTLEQKVGAFLQHHPVRALPLLLELLVEFKDELEKRGHLFPREPDDSTARPD